MMEAFPADVCVVQISKFYSFKIFFLHLRQEIKKKDTFTLQNKTPMFKSSEILTPSGVMNVLQVAINFFFF